jgi:sensor histidine kinase YesM
LYFLGVTNRLFIVYITEPFFADYPKDSITDIFYDIRYLLFHYIFPLISGAFIFISIMFILRYKNEKNNRLQLQKEKTELELRILKSQLNPHFLFNTLNNIYSLSISNSAATAQSISRLSDMLDYILNKGQNKLVAAAEELKIIDDYIELEKLRYDERLKIHKVENIEFTSFIPPLLYLSLVENAFKHGAEKISGKIEINISLITNLNFAIFKVENHFSKTITDDRIGIGLKNIRKQLDLYYADQYSFEIKKLENLFSIKLTTPLYHD